jgi:hypothetical protein
MQFASQYGERRLEQEKWVESRPGSGTYVCGQCAEHAAPAILELDQLIRQFFQSTRRLGLPVLSVRTRLQHWFQQRRPEHFLVIEPDVELRNILVAEIQNAVQLKVKACGPKVLTPKMLAAAAPIALARTAGKLNIPLPPYSEMLTIEVSSARSSLANWLPVPPTAIVAVASRWPRFVELARTMLLAARIAPDCLLFRDARKKDWQRGLAEASVVVCDSLTAEKLTEHRRPIVFGLIAETSLAEVRKFEQFLSR